MVSLGVGEILCGPNHKRNKAISLVAVGPSAKSLTFGGSNGKSDLLEGSRAGQGRAGEGRGGEGRGDPKSKVPTK